MDTLSPSFFADWSSTFGDIFDLCGGVILESCLYGVYIVLFVTSINSLRKGPKHSTGTIFQLFSLCLMFALSTGLWAIDITILVLELRVIRLAVSPQPDAIDQLKATAIGSYKAIFANKILFESNFLIGDLLIAWRVCVLYKSQSISRWIRCVFAILWLGMTAVVIGETACWIPTMVNISTPDSPVCFRLRKAAWTTSLGLNAVGSLLIWRVIRQRRLMLRALPNGVGFGKSKVDRVLSILLGSSVLYILSGLAVFVGQFGVGDETQRVRYSNFIVPSSNQVLGLYPTIVTTFVLNQDTIFGPLSSAPTTASGTTASIKFNGRLESQAVGLSSTRTAEAGTYDA